MNSVLKYKFYYSVLVRILAIFLLIFVISALLSLGFDLRTDKPALAL
ncbi:hypothetical protein NSP_19040 [Nodularia spumigena CCY9414]|nr:hypothetical protein NSP_19040 [Nodularia spumigena CCY9414]